MSNEVLDLTARMVSNLRRARAQGRRLFWLIISADSCPGCEVLEQQMDQAALRTSLGPDVYIVRVIVGDLYDDPPRKVRLGRWVLECAGFPTSWVFTLDEQSLTFHSLALGPLPENAIDAAQGLMDGRSVWVPEAGAMSMQACSDVLCIDLSEANDFNVPFKIHLEAGETPS